MYGVTCCRSFFYQSLNGLLYMHETAKVIHRDLKRESLVVGSLHPQSPDSGGTVLDAVAAGPHPVLLYLA